jgi:putative transcriptional regulator
MLYLNPGYVIMIECHLESLMAARSLSLYKLAKDTGVHRNTLRALVRNSAKQFDAGLLDLLCRYFECPLEALISFNKQEVGRICLKRPGAGKRKSARPSAISENVERILPTFDDTPAGTIAKTLSAERVKKRSAKIHADATKRLSKTRSAKPKSPGKKQLVSTQIDAFEV